MVALFTLDIPWPRMPFVTRLMGSKTINSGVLRREVDLATEVLGCSGVALARDEGLFS